MTVLGPSHCHASAILSTSTDSISLQNLKVLSVLQQAMCLSFSVDTSDEAITEEVIRRYLLQSYGHRSALYPACVSLPGVKVPN